MKVAQIFVLALLMCASFAFSANWQPAQTDTSQCLKPQKILFIGNSYTYYNDLDAVVKKLAASAKPAVELHTVPLVEGGATLEKHYSDPKTQSVLSKVKWDFVILQEHSMRPVEDTASFFEYARKMEAEVEKQGAKPVFFMTWAREHKPEMTSSLDKAYTQMGRELNAYVAPVGLAWAASLKANPEIKLYDEDKSHPNVHGTYLAACVFYATLTGRSPVGLSNAGLEEVTAENAKALQEVAWKTVSEYAKKHSGRQNTG
jgi:hypothetical protein